MRKIIIVSAMVMAYAVAFSFQAYASFHKEAKDPDSKTVKAVHRDFPQAEKVVWGEDEGYFIARFNSHHSKITAIYHKGKLLSALIYSDAANIPLEMQSSLAKKYPDYVPRCMKEYITRNDHSYYFILKHQKGRLVKWLSIKSNDDGDFTVLLRLHQTV